MKNPITLCLFTLILAVSLVGCKKTSSQSKESKLTIKGSDTMVILNQRWAEEYMKENPHVSIQVTGGGSGTGLAALQQGSTDLAAASRPIKEKEKEHVEKAFHKMVIEIPVAIDALTIFTNKNNPIKELSIKQLQKIFSGEIKNWHEVGGSDSEIIVYSRENNSGTYDFFKEHVLKGEDFSETASYLPGTAAIISAIQRDIHGIGYGGIAYLPKEISALSIKKDDSSRAVPPILQNIKNHEYPLARELYFYSIGEPEGLSKSFIEYALSLEGQKVCEQVGYFPIK